MNYWIGCSFKSNAYTKVIDSLKQMEVQNELKLQAKDYEIKECNNLLKTREELIEVQNIKVTQFEAELKKESEKKTLWKRISGGFGILSGFFIIKEAIKR